MNQTLKQQLVDVLRSLGLLTTVERAYLTLAAGKFSGDDDAFRREHPEFVAPPQALIYETFGPVALGGYWAGGLSHARCIASLIEKHSSRPDRILEWGCGTARMLSHMTSFLPESQLFGTDYNDKAITWCKATFGNISFTKNNLHPPLSFADEYFDVIYGLSVLTHLSASVQSMWISELRRVLRANGCLILTTIGKQQSARVLLPRERSQLMRDGFVTRSRVMDGSRCFVSYHRPDYAKDHLFGDFQLLEYIPDGATEIQQDVWVLRKPANDT